MSLLALLTAQTGPAPVDPYAPIRSVPAPGPMEARAASALVAPYNAETWVPLPSNPPYEAGYGTHPSVKDMKAATGKDTWNGWRYWMAWTPHVRANEATENPCICVSNDLKTWVIPAGLTNPIEPAPPGDYRKNYNSDTDLVYDPDTGRLWCYWRTVVADADEVIQARWSTDGITWNGPIEMFRTGALTAALSPAIMRVAKGHWRMYYIGDRGYPTGFRTAPTPQGPWSRHVDVNFATWLDPGTRPWHMSCNYEHGQFRMLIQSHPTPTGLNAAVSNDGVNFHVGPRFMVAEKPWETALYRSCMVPADNGTDYHLWYSVTGSGWRTGQTMVPKSYWWDLDPRRSA